MSLFPFVGKGFFVGKLIDLDFFIKGGDKSDVFYKYNCI
jgi:hypothetical protein